MGQVPEALLNSVLTRPRATLFWEDPFSVARNEGAPVIRADSLNALYVICPNGDVNYHDAWVASLISAGIWSGDPPRRHGSGAVGQWAWRAAQDDSTIQFSDSVSGSDRDDSGDQAEGAQSTKRSRNQYA